MGVSLLAFTSTILRTCGRILYSYLFPVAIGLMLMVSPAHAQFTITENFKSSSAGNVTLGGSAKLTSGTIDPVGDGWLRLTEDKNNDVGYAFVNQGFPSTLGVLMDFEYVSWRRSNAPGFPMGADGFSIFLFDDNVTATTFRLGAAGGSLGYAQSTSSGNTGLNGGYVGIGIDEFGNYSTCSDGKSGGEPNCNFGHPDLISARGPAPNYAYIQGSSVGTSLDYDVLTNTRPTAAQFYRRVQIQITKTGPAGSYQILVKSTTTPGGTLTTLFGPVTLSSPPPARLKLGFAASTGGAWNKHEVRNLIITTPGNIRVQKLVDKSTVKVGDQLTYRITTYNETAAAITGLPLKDTFPAGFSPTSITFSNDGFAGNTASGYTNTDLSNARLNMAANSNSTFIVTGTVTSKPIGGTLTNTARVDPAAAGITDGDPTNDVSSASTQVISPDFTVTKTHTGNLRKSLSGSFTITVRNSGTDPQPLNSAVNLTDVIPAGFTVTGAPTGTGWSFTGTSGNSIVASRSDQLAAGSSYPLITIPVRVDVNAANSLTNMAVVKNAYDANAANDTSRDVVDTRRNMDLQVVSYVLPSQKKGCVGTPYNVQVNIRNNGPDSALNGRFNFKVPTASNVITLVSRTITSGAGSFSGGSTDPVNGYTDFVTLTSGAAATYIFSVLVTNPAPADLAICEATLLRSSTDLDIDASDPTIAIPTDPQHECDALPSGPTCNNILRDTVFVSSTVTANAGPDQQLCNTTTGQLAATAPPSGTGAWSQYTGPNTAGITNPALNNTTITNLAPGTYGFIWTITNGGCAPAKDTVLVTVYAAPTPANAGPDQQLCNVTTTNLQGNTPVTGTGTWRQLTGPNTPTIANPALTNTSVQGMVAGTYTFEWAITNGNCPPSRDTVQIVISPLPSAANAGPDQVLCNVTSTTMAANTPTAGSGSWSQIAGSNTASFVNAAAPNSTVQNLIAGSYSFVWTISSGNCAPAKDTVVVLVNAAPTTANAGPDQTKNNAGTFTMSGNAPTVGQGTWALVSGSGSIANTTDPNTTITLQPNTTGTFTWTIRNGNCPPSIDTVVLRYVRQADLKITKTDAGNTYKTGSALTYTITVENLGPSDVTSSTGGVVQDLLPANMTNYSWTSVSTGAGVALTPASGTGRSISSDADLPFVAGNKIVITVTGNVVGTAKRGDTVRNVASIATPIEVPDPNQNNNVSIVTGVVPNNPPIAVDDQYTTKRDVPVSGNVLTNDSDLDGDPLTVTTTPITPPTNGTVKLNADGTFTYTPKPGFTGTDTFVYQVCDNQGACSQATVTITVTAAEADLSVVKTATPSPAVAGQALTYTLTVTNSGPSTIQPGETFKVVDSLPDGFIPDTYTPSAGSYTSATGSWTNVTLAPGNTVTLTITGKVSSQYAGTSLTNKASVTPPPNVVDTTPSTSVIVTPVSKSVEIVVTKTDNTDTYTAGTDTEYKITIENKGPSDLVGGRIKDTLPAGITVASWSAVMQGSTQPLGSGTGRIDQPLDLPAGKTIVYTLDILIPSGYTGPLVNKAEVTVPSGYNNINPSANSATDTDNPDPKVNIVAMKSGPANVAAGTNISYQLKIVNNGPSDVTNITIADVLDNRITGGTWTVTTTGGATASVTNGNGNVNFTGNIRGIAGDTIIVNISGLVAPAASGSIDNTATVTIPGKPAVSSNTVNTVIDNKTGLTLSKAGPASGRVNAGDPIRYTLRLINEGPSNATGVALKDVAPANITGVTWTVTKLGLASVASGAPSSGTGNNISTTVNLPAGDTNVIIVQIDGIVSSSVKANDTLVNIATATGTDGKTVTATNKTVVDNKPGIKIVKSGPASADAGTDIKYILTVTNDGPSDAVNAVINDAVDATSFSNVTWTATASGTAVVNSGATGNGYTVAVNANIPAGANNKVTIEITGSIRAAASGTIDNDANVVVNNQTTPSNEVKTIINNNPGLELEKSGPDTATAGGNITWLLQLTNNGPSDAFQATVKDTLPAGIIFSGATFFTTVKGNASVTSSQLVNGVLQVVANIGAADTNSITISITAPIDPAYNKADIRNKASVSTPGKPDITTPEVPTIIVSKPQLVLHKSAPDTVVAGQQITYTIEATNTGLSDAKGTVITDNVVATLTNVKWSTSTTGTAAVTAGATGTGNGVSVTGDVPANGKGSIVITITGDVPASFTGDIANHATGNIPGKPPVTSDTTSTHIVSKPQLQITKSAPGRVSAGGIISYVVTVTNAGPSDAVGVNIADALNQQYLAPTPDWTATGTNGATVTSGASGSGYAVAVTGNIPAGKGAITITINGTIDPAVAGTLMNTATATVPGMPPVDASAQTNVTSDPAISVTKSGPQELHAGDSVTYTLVVTNFGQSDAQNVKIEDVVPSVVKGVQWTTTTTGGKVNITSGATGTGNNVSLSAYMPAGTSNHIFVTVTGKVDPALSDTTISNFASGIVPGKDTTRSDTIPTKITNTPGLQIVKSAPDTAAAGSKVTFTLTVTNTGPSDAKDIAIADAVSANLKNVTWSAVTMGNATVRSSNGSLNGTGNNVSYTGSIAAGAGNSIVVTIQGTIDPAFAGDIPNSATVTATGKTPVNSNTTNTNVVKRTSVTISKSAPDNAAAGEYILYVLNIVNNGPSDATGIKITDTVPAALSNVDWIAVPQGGATITGAASGSGNQISITGNIPADTTGNNTITVIITGRIDSSYTGAPLRNTATAETPDQPVPGRDTTTTVVDVKPNVQVMKSGPSSLFAGQDITYTIRVTNGGPSNAVNASITDVLDPAILNPSWTAQVQGTGTSVSSNSGTGNINITGNIPAGTGNIITITVKGKLDPNFKGSNLLNTATAAVAGQQPSSSTVNTTVTRRADLRAVKSGPANAVAGEKITYTITVNNLGPSAVTNATITDVIPSNILQPTWSATAIGAGSSVSAGAGSGNINLTATIPADTSKIVIVVNGTIDPSTLAGTNITNTVTATPPPDIEDPNPATASVTTMVRREADLAIVKTGPANVTAGGDITYQLVITNNGISDVTNAVITDNIPASISISSATATATNNASAVMPTVTGNTVSLNGSIAAGKGNSIIVTIKGQVDPSATGTLTNTATVTAPPDVTETLPSNNTSTINTTVNTDLGLQVSKSGPASVNVNDTIVYTIVVSNNGISDANNLTVTDLVPADINVLSWTATPTGNADITPTSGTGNNISLTGRVGASNGGFITIVVTGVVKTTAANTITNTVTATSGTVKTSTLVTTVNKSVDLRINKTAPAKMAAGEQITYVINVTNAGPADAMGATIQDQIPAGINGIKWTAVATNGTVSPASGTSGSINLTADIPANTGQVTLTVTGTVDPAFSGTLVNTASAMPPAGVTDPHPAIVTVSTEVTAVPGLSVVKSAPVQVNAGDTINYMLEVRNTGPSAATGVNIRDTLSANITNVTWSSTASGATVTDPGTGSGNIVNLTGDIPVNGLITVFIKGVVNPAFTGNILNKAVATGNGQTTTSNETDTRVVNQPGLTIRKSGPTTLAAGRQISYAIRVGNNGPSAAQGVTISDLLPATVKNATWSATANGGAVIAGGNISNRPGNVTFQADIPAGASNMVLVTINGILDAAATDSVVNGASVVTAGGEAITDTARTRIVSQPGLRLVKAAPDTASAGNVITYTIDVYNDGPSNAVNAMITDTLPVQLLNPVWSATAAGAATISGGNLQQQQGNVRFTANVPAGPDNIIHIVVTGTLNPAFTGAVNNHANANVGGTDYTSNIVTTQVNSKPGLELVKSGPTTATAGSTISYNIVLTNNGPSDASGIVVNDVLPAQLQNAKWSATAAGNAAITGGNITDRTGNVNFTASVPAGASNRVVVNVSGIIDPAFVGNITNVASYTLSGNTITTPPVITTVTAQAAIKVTKAGPDTVAAGGNINYTLVVTNNGPSNANNINITDIVPASVQNVSWTAVANGATINGSASGTGNNINVNASIPAGANNSIMVNITGTTAPGTTGIITNTATVDFNGKPVSKDSVSTQVVNKPGVLLTKSGPQRLSAGSKIIYTIDLTNAGPSDLVNALVTDRVPSVIRDVTWTIQLQGNASFPSATTTSGTGNLVNFRVNVPAGAGNGVHVTVTGTTNPDSTGRVTNVATATDNNGNNYTADVVTNVVRQAAVDIVKIGPDSIHAGDGINYEIIATNNGPSNASNVVITDQVPAGIGNVTWQAVATGSAKINGPASGTGNSISVQADIPAGAANSIQILISGELAANAPAGTITNTATLKTPDTTIVTPPVTTEVTKSTGISLTKVAAATANAGDSLQFNITATNNGPSDAADVLITDVVPATLQGVSWIATAAGKAQVISGGTGTGNNVSLHAMIPAGTGNTINIRIIGKIDPLFTGTINNNATAVSGGSTSTSNITTTAVTRTMDLSITKSGPARVTTGDSITYVLNARNSGPASGDGAVITDVLPAGISGAYGVVTAATGGAGNVQIVVSGGTVKATVGTFPANAIVRIAITGQVQNVSSLTNQATINVPDGGTDPTPGNNTSDKVVTIVDRVAKVSDIRLKKELLNNSPLQVAGKADFQITLSNAGPDTALAIVVKDTLRNNLDVLGGITVSAGVVHYDPITRIITWNVDNLPVTQTATLKVTARINNTGTVVNSATATGLLPDPDLSNNTSTTSAVTVTGDDVFIPNTITPNGDGKNDKFTIIGIDRYPNSTLFIYNRWGNQVYQSKNYQNEWTGEGLNEGTYYYVLKLRSQDGKVREYKGWILLVR